MSKPSTRNTAANLAAIQTSQLLWTGRADRRAARSAVWATANPPLPREERDHAAESILQPVGQHSGTQALAPVGKQP